MIIEVFYLSFLIKVFLSSLIEVAMNSGVNKATFGPNK